MVYFCVIYIVIFIMFITEPVVVNYNEFTNNVYQFLILTDEL